jgi:hypothetical protein
MRAFEVVGDVMGDEEIEGDVMGGDIAEVVGAAVHKAIVKATRGGGNIRVKRPGWRGNTLAPGVEVPDEGMVPLGMKADSGSPLGTFSSTLSFMTFTGRQQKPYRAERFLVSVVRTGATAVGRLLGQFFVGVDLNQGAIQGVDIELYGAVTAFGTRLTLLQAPPGVDISVPVTLSSGLTAPDTIFATLQWSGRIVH